MKTYKVWLEIEEHDDETDSFTTLDAPGASLADFPTYKQAWQFCEGVMDAYGDRTDVRSARAELLEACKEALKWIESAANTLGEHPVVPHKLRRLIQEVEQD